MRALWQAMASLLVVPVAISAQELVDVGGHRLDVLVRGSGSPVVVLESGQGEGREYWESVQDSIAQFATVLAYSRSGLGESDYSPRPGAIEAVAELRALLRAQDLKGPYVLVGHSLGGWYVRTYAAQFPDEVAGLVLVDATSEHVWRDWAKRWPTFWEDYDKDMADWLAEVARATREEEDFFREVTGDRGLPEAEPLPSIPLGVVTAMRPDPSWVGGTPEAMVMWLAHHQAFAARSMRSIHLVSDQTGHIVQADEPELIVDAVRFVIESVRREVR